MNKQRIDFHSFIVSIFWIVLFSCSSVKQVNFESPVDTTNKPIDYQVKKTYHLPDLNIYASNDFDGARLNDLKKLNDSTALAIILPENTPINDSPYYAFKTWANVDRSFYIEFKYPEGYRHRYIPKIKIGEDWAVIDSSNVFKQDSIVTIKLNLTKVPIIVSAQEIQASSDVKEWVSTITKGKENFINYKVYGKTPLGRDLSVLNIGIGSQRNKDVIVLLTRQHPPEVTGYYAFQSFMETLVSDSDLSRSFLSKYHVLAFPLMNPDGVDLGHWRHCSGGVDLNRDWSVYNQPEIKQTVKYIQKQLKRNKARIVLGLDFHSTWYDVFYTNKTREQTALPNFIDDWFRSLESNIPDYKVNESSSNSKKPVSKGWFLRGHNAVGITYEIGDATSKEDIKRIGSVSAEQMMNILTKTN